MVWDEHSLKISALQLLRFGCYDVLKIWRKRIAQSVNQLINHEAVCKTASATPGLLNIRRECDKNDIGF